ALGLALIGVALFGFTENTPFPSLYALIPCVGTALAILGGRARYLGRLLSNAPMVFVGEISYSLYLVHWPIIVFCKYNRIDSLSLPDEWAICAAAVVLATLMYRFVETPFRRPRGAAATAPRAEFALGCVGLVLLVMFPAAVVWAKGSLLWRGP